MLNNVKSMLESQSKERLDDVFKKLRAEGVYIPPFVDVKLEGVDWIYQHCRKHRPLVYDKIMVMLSESQIIPSGEENILSSLKASEVNLNTGMSIEPTVLVPSGEKNAIDIFEVKQESNKTKMESHVLFNYLATNVLSWKPVKSKSKVDPKYDKYANTGYDCFALVLPLKEIVLAPMQQALIPLGFSMVLSKDLINVSGIPHYIDAEIRPRSGLALKNKISITNSPGTIDNEYDSPVAVILQNLGTEDFIIKNGDKICQLILDLKPILEESENKILFDESKFTKDTLSLLDGKSRQNDKGETGFGSSGV